MGQNTRDMLYDQLVSTRETLVEVWEAADGARECPGCEGAGFLYNDDTAATDHLACETCGSGGTVDTYEDQDAVDYLDEMPLGIVWELGEEFAVVLGTGGPHVEIVGGGRNGGYRLVGHWAGETVTVTGEAITRTGEHFRSMVEE